jgi:threonine dehydrogenase-like Zn-dependent dehydrogenase
LISLQDRLMRSVYIERSIPRIILSKLTRRVWPWLSRSGWGPIGEWAAGSQPLPGPGWIRLRNLQAGICASDVALLRAQIDPRITLAALPGRERTYLGHEVVSEVIETGTRASGLAAGDRVILDTRFQGPTCRSTETAETCAHCQAGNHMLCDNPNRYPAELGVGGGWSEEIVCHASEVYPVPVGLTDAQALLVEPFSLGMRAALKSLPGAGERCLVVGSGMAGLSIIQTVRLLSPDCHITVVGRHPNQSTMAEKVGADQVLASLDVARLAAASRAKLFSGPAGSYFVMGGYDTVFDCVGSTATLNAGLRLARPGATVVLVGISFRPARVDLSPVWHQEVRLIGVLAHGRERWESTDTHTYDLVCRNMLSGGLTTEGFITDHYSLSDWPRAVRRADARHDGVIRVVLDTSR